MSPGEDFVERLSETLDTEVRTQAMVEAFQKSHQDHLLQALKTSCVAIARKHLNKI